MLLGRYGRQIKSGGLSLASSLTRDGHCDVVGQCFGIDTKDGTILKEPQTPRLALPKLIETQQGIVADVQSSGSGRWERQLKGG